MMIIVECFKGVVEMSFIVNFIFVLYVFLVYSFSLFLFLFVVPCFIFELINQNDIKGFWKKFKEVMKGVSKDEKSDN